MERGPRWTLRLGALALATAPFLGGVRAGSWGYVQFIGRGFLGNLFGQSPMIWGFLCLLPFLASFAAFRERPRAAVATALAYLALLFELTRSWVPSGPLVLHVAGGVAALLLRAFQVRLWECALWARVSNAVVLLVAGLMHAESGGRACFPEASVVVLGALLVAAGEIWSLRSAGDS